MKHYRSALWLLIFFVLSILIRLPNLDRPLSKHHEFNTAVVLIGLESWQQGGGAQNFHFVPLLTYQNPADKLLQKGPYIDSLGNHIYLSIGPGWYVIPYLIFTTFKIPFTPLPLQILNLFFLLASVLLLYRFIYYLCSKAGYEPVFPSLAGCFVFLFNPSILWFMGNGYVCTGMALPFLIMILHYGVKMLYEPGQIKTKILLVYLLAGICSIYTDWYGVSFLASICFASLLKIRRNKKYWILFGVSAFAIVLGILIILFQFVSYAGWQKVYDYWTSRYLDRGLANPHINKVSYIFYIVQHLITSFLPVILAMVMGFVIIKKKAINNAVAQPIRIALTISLLACLLHSAIFLNWAGDHDFAMIPYSIFLALLTGWMIHHLARTKYILWLAAFTFFTTVTQYYYINFPGRYTAKGLPYDSYQKTGNLIRQLSRPGERVFCNVNYAIYQFYAKRNFTGVDSYESALEWARLHQVKKGIWIKIQETPNRISVEEIKHFNND